MNIRYLRPRSTPPVSYWQAIHNSFARFCAEATELAERSGDPRIVKFVAFMRAACDEIASLR